MASRSLLSSCFRRRSSPLGASEAREIPAGTRSLEPVGYALLVGFGYYIGTHIGFLLTPTGQPNSTFWPPNAILLAALVLAPRRSWWMLMIAVLPAHMFAQREVGVPFWTAAAWFISNTSEALIGAFCITRFAEPRRLFETVRGVFLFVIFGVLIAPFATSFLDAAGVVLSGWGHGYLPIGAERFWTNALAELTIVPIIVLAASNPVQRIHKASVARYCEAGLLGLSTVLVTFLIFGLQPLPLSAFPAIFYAPLLVLLWATARFGSGGLCLCLLVVALMAIGYALDGREPFASASLRQNVLSMQILLCMIAVPLLFLSAYMTEARCAQESLRHMAANLIAGQEQERTRIARELHDDVNQRLAMLAVGIGQLQDNPAELESRVQELQRQTIELSNDVQALSHDLHSAKFEYLGFVAGISSWCREITERREIEVDFQSRVSSVLPWEVGICLFRVLQEAIHNAIKHSGVKRVEVQLWEAGRDVHLSVSDLGRGFEVEDGLQGKGLGLTSMRERVRLVKGTFSIHSQPTRGTTVHVRIPLHSELAA
jgi:signal transduction histidine kinase